MKRLSELLQGVECVQIAGDTGIDIGSLALDSRQVTDGGCFFAVTGAADDGHRYIASAVERGAAAVICEHLPASAYLVPCTFVVVEDASKAVALMAANYYGNPSRRLKVVGVTGTNGKTTIATLLHDLFRAAGHKSGLISTVVYRVGDREIASTHTTPDAIRLQQMLHEMAESGCEYCFMECSSHAIVQRRIYGIDFTGALFTNLTHDHLDYHKTFAEYVRAKKLFFDELPKGAFALVNADDRNGRVMLQNTRAAQKTLSMRSMADFRCKIVEMMPGGMLLRVEGMEVWVRLVGRFNAYNLLTVYGAAVLLGMEASEALTRMSLLESVCGRMQTVAAADGTTAIVDYAHTPDALKNVLETVGEIRGKGRRLIVVCGCGGDRDRTKRPEMAAIAVGGADTAIFTSDNPRSEDPQAILADMEAGVRSGDHYIKIADRDEAIRTAVLLANAGDMILVAGKGHENYQIVGDERLPFNDRECIEKYFRHFNR